MTLKYDGQQALLLRRTLIARIQRIHQFLNGILQHGKLRFSGALCLLQRGSHGEDARIQLLIRIDVVCAERVELFGDFRCVLLVVLDLRFDFGEEGGRRRFDFMHFCFEVACELFPFSHEVGAELAVRLLHFVDALLHVFRHAVELAIH